MGKPKRRKAPFRNKKRKRRWKRKEFVRMAGACLVCGEPMTMQIRDGVGDNFATIDHKQPLAKGGSHDRANLMLMCRRCNNEKADQYPD